MYSKDEILELYLNKVYFGDGLYGVEAPSRGLFRQARVRGLACAEAALLAGLVKSPSQLRAHRQPGARRRAPQRRPAGDARDTASSIDAVWKAARASPIVLRDDAAARRAVRPVFQGAGPARAGRAVRLAARLPGRAARLLDDRHADAGGRRGRRRRAASRRSSSGARRSPARPAAKDRRRRPSRSCRCRRRSSPWIPRPATCARMVGGRDFDESRFNRAVQARAAAGLGVQAVRVRGRARSGLHAGDDDRAPGRCRSHTLEGAWTPEDEHSDRRLDELRTGAAHVEQSRRGAAAAGRRHPPTVQYAKALGRRRRAERAVAGARLGRSHAAVDDGGLRRVRQPRAACPQPILIRRVEDRDGPRAVSGRGRSRRARSARRRRS